MVAKQLVARDIHNADVLAVMGRVPRHEFVPEGLRGRAYDDTALPIGEGQTISQPYIVAFMTEAINPQAGQRVLEIGTGSGYQAAVLSDLVGDVYTIELLTTLAQEARSRLERLGYHNVRVRTGDGFFGWPEASPFDAVVVTCGADQVPEALFEQLKSGGKMVIPVGPAREVQQLRLIEKGPHGEKKTRELLPVRFVPLRHSGS
jgi:protein-L-isoaspartate(D-aspartate) O-methyltransferase